MSMHLSTRRGFTIVELLIVIIILSIVTIATIPIIKPALDTRRIREASRMLAAHISEAQARAVESGRPTGIWIERLRTGSGPTAGRVLSAATNIFLCEVPPPYCGDTVNSVITVRAVNASPNYATVQFSGVDQAWFGLLKPYDLIRFKFGGAWYQLNGMMENPSSAGSFMPETVELPTGSGNIVLKLDTSMPQKFQIVPTSTADPTFRFPPAAFTASGWQVQYQINRQPIKLSTTPLQLPPGTVIDLFYSGIGSSCFESIINTTSVPPLKFTYDPGALGFTFSPSGALDKFYAVGTYQQLSQPVYLLLGKREKVATDTSSSSTYPAVLDPAYTPSDPREAQSEKHNFRDLENLWVSINPQTGLVSTADMAEFPTPGGGITQDQQLYNDLTNALGRSPTADEAIANAVSRSRQNATSAQTMGGL